jgi:hypothetical protein
MVMTWKLIAGWIALWAIAATSMLLCTAPHIRALRVGEHADVSGGPIHVFTVTKMTAGTGGVYTFSFTMRAGMVLLGVACLGAEALAFIAIPAFIRHAHHKRMVHGSKK